MQRRLEDVIFILRKSFQKLVSLRRIINQYNPFHESCQPNRATDAVHQDVVVVATSLPHGETVQTSVQNVLALRSKRLGIVIRNKDVVGRVPHGRRLAAIIIARDNTVQRSATLVQEPSLRNQTPEGVGTGVRLRVATVINCRVVVPAGALKAVAAVEVGVHVQLRAVAQGRRRIDAEAVAVCRNAKNNLVGGDAGRDPGVDARRRGALVVARIACRGERRIGARIGRPHAVQVVVHNHNVIQYIGKPAQVRRLDAVGIVPGEERRCGRELDVGRTRERAQLLQKEEEVGRVVGADGVAAQALAVGVLEVEVKTVEAVLVDKVHAGLREGGAILGRSEVGREVLAAGPASDGDESFHALGKNVRMK